MPESKPALRLVIFDWAGTTIDHGSQAPLAAFVEAFARHGIEITTAQAREPMGLHKREQLRTILRNRPVAQRWREVHGTDADEAALDAIYKTYVPLQLDVLDRHCRLIPGLTDCVEQLRRRGLRIGATTGYFREAAERVYRAAQIQGYAPDCCLCAENVPEGRPAPWMIFHIMEALRIYPASAVVKIGDTVPDIHEGLNAGAWTVGVIRTGSLVGCTEEELAALAEDERAARLERARRLLLAAGAHAVIDSVAELPELLDRFPFVTPRSSDRP